MLQPKTEYKLQEINQEIDLKAQKGLMNKRNVKLVAFVLAILLLIYLTLLVSGRGFLVYEKFVKPGTSYKLEDWGDLGNFSKPKLVCKYFMAQSVLTKVYDYSYDINYGKDGCTFIINERD